MRVLTPTLLMLCERVNCSFKEANPRSEGPNSRSERANPRSEGANSRSM